MRLALILVAGFILAAAIAQNYTVTVTLAGTGTGTVQSVGSNAISCPGTCSLQGPDGTGPTLVAMAAAGSVFSGWQVTGTEFPCSTSPTCSIEIYRSNVAVTATFNATGPNRNLSVTVAGSGSVSSSPVGINSCANSCTAQFPQNSSVTLTAIPAAGFSFQGWSGACTGAGVCALTMDTNKSITAIFVTSVTLTVIVNGPGSVQSSLNQINCPTLCSATFPTGATLFLFAYPSTTPPSLFNNWSNGPCSGSGACQVTLTGNLSVTANFVARNQVQTQLMFFRNYFVTGDYVVGGVGLEGQTEGTFTVNGVPAEADILAAYLYWQAIGAAPTISFRSYKTTDTQIGSAMAACENPNTPSTYITYRADVLKNHPLTGTKPQYGID
jgi:hypothetical protein